MKCLNCGAEISGKFCEYCGAKSPEINQNIVINNYYTVDPYYANTQVPPARSLLYSDKKKNVALILCIFLGFIGAHQFYVGKIGMGLLYLFTGGLFCFGWWIDIALIATKRFKDGKGLTLIEN